MAHELLIACVLACLRMTVSPVASHSLGAPGAFPSSTSNDFSAGADFSASARHRSRAVRARTSFPWPTPHVCRRRARVCSMPLWEESSPQLYWPQSAGEFFLCVRRAAAIGWSEQHGSCGSVAGMLANWTFTETAIPPRGCTASCYVFRSMTPRRMRRAANIFATVIGAPGRPHAKQLCAHLQGNVPPPASTTRLSTRAPSSTEIIPLARRVTLASV
jgi:hypothetical protein